VSFATHLTHLLWNLTAIQPKKLNKGTQETHRLAN